MIRTNYFVTTIIGRGRLRRLAGDSKAILPKVVGITQVKKPGLKSIMLPR
jgi:hypothetical protein